MRPGPPLSLRRLRYVGVQRLNYFRQRGDGLGRFRRVSTGVPSSVGGDAEGIVCLSILRVREPN